MTAIKSEELSHLHILVLRHILAELKCQGLVDLSAGDALVTTCTIELNIYKSPALPTLTPSDLALCGPYPVPSSVTRGGHHQGSLHLVLMHGLARDYAPPIAKFP